MGSIVLGCESKRVAAGLLNDVELVVDLTQGVMGMQQENKQQNVWETRFSL